MKTVALLPAKRFSRGKSRLAGVLDDDARAELGRALFTHVLRAAKESGAFDELFVVTDGADVTEVATRFGATLLADPPSTHLGEIVDSAIARIISRADVVVVLMGDLPTLTTDDVRTLVRGSMNAELVVAPDARDEGTNALAMRLSAIARTQLGHADSFARHLALAGQLRVAVQRSPGLGFDVDTVRDWERLAREPIVQPAVRNRTRSSRVSER
ncbi:MAG: 2-phospho-L-lactate guanylyltransferase [Polyangiales bacterium]